MILNEYRYRGIEQWGGGGSMHLPKYMSSSSIFCWLASVARVAIALHNSINEGGGNKATLNGVRINISPDNNIQVIRRPLITAMEKIEREREREMNKKYEFMYSRSVNRACLIMLCSSQKKHGLHEHRCCDLIGFVAFLIEFSCMFCDLFIFLKIISMPHIFVFVHLLIRSGIWTCNFICIFNCGRTDEPIKVEL